MTDEERLAKFKSIMVSMVKAAGQEVIDRAEDIVGTGDKTSSLEISICFEQGPFMTVPTLKITREHMAKRVFEIMKNRKGGDAI